MSNTMRHQFFNYLNQTRVVKLLKRHGLMNRTKAEALRESELRRLITEYNLIQRKESKASARARRLIIKSIEKYAEAGIITLKPVQKDV